MVKLLNRSKIDYFIRAITLHTFSA